MSMHFFDPEELERHKQEHRANAHDISNLIQDLSQDHLRVIGMMFEAVATSDNPNMIAGFWAGRMNQAMEHRFGVCTACGENHDVQMTSLTPTRPPVEVPPWVNPRRESATYHQIGWTKIGSIGPLNEAEQKLMEEFGLDDLREEGTMKLLGFICVNCNMQYQTIQDRMIEKPGVEGCSGCLQKAKFG